MIQRRRVPNPFRRRIPTKGQVCLTRFHVTRPFWSGFNTHNIYFFLCNKKRSIFLYRNCIIFLRSFDADRYSIYLLQERYGEEIKNQCSLSPRQQYKRNLPNRKRNVFFHYSDNAEKTQNILSFVAIFADTSIATSKASLMAILPQLKMPCRRRV